MNVFKGLLISICLLVLSCKEECILCSKDCINFRDFKVVYCVTDFEDSAAFQVWIDSMESHYEIQYEDIWYQEVCDKSTIPLMETDNWSCSE